MNNRTLHAFLSLADTLHFGRAADACHMSLSTLSRAIKQLESKLKVRLFDRDNRSVTLTNEGELFRQYARESLSLWDSFHNSLMDETRELHGELVLYCSVTASYSFLFTLLTEFRKRHPRIRIKLHTGEPEQAVAHVQSGEAQISIGAKPASLHGSLAFKKITRTSLVFIAPRSDVSLRRLPAPSAPAVQWATIPMILPQAGIARDYIDKWFRHRGVTPNIWAQVAGNEAIVSMVSLGDGVGVVPRIVLDNSPLAGRVRMLNVKPQLGSLDVGLFVRKKNLHNRLIDALWSVSHPLSAN